VGLDPGYESLEPITQWRLVTGYKIKHQISPKPQPEIENLGKQLLCLHFMGSVWNFVPRYKISRVFKRYRAQLWNLLPQCKTCWRQTSQLSNHYLYCKGGAKGRGWGRRGGGSEQGCQMVYFQTKNRNLGKFWRAL
jgi:hypothetical protein